MMQAFTMSIFRHVLTGMGAVLVSKGYVDAAATEAIIGGLIAGAGLLWSAADKARR